MVRRPRPMAACREDRVVQVAAHSAEACVADEASAGLVALVDSAVRTVPADLAAGPAGGAVLVVVPVAWRHLEWQRSGVTR